MPSIDFFPLQFEWCTRLGKFKWWNITCMARAWYCDSCLAMQIESKHRFENIGSNEMDEWKIAGKSIGTIGKIAVPEVHCTKVYVVSTHIMFVLNGWSQSIKLCSVFHVKCYTNIRPPTHSHTHTDININIWCWLSKFSRLFTNLVQCSQVFMYLLKSTSSLRLTTNERWKNQNNHWTKESVKNEITKYT